MLMSTFHDTADAKCPGNVQEAHFSICTIPKEIVRRGLYGAHHDDRRDTVKGAGGGGQDVYSRRFGPA